MSSGTSTFVEVLAALAPILLVVLAGVGWLYRHERERREGVERQLSEHKYKAYIRLIEIFFDQFKAMALNRPQMNQQELIERMADANKELMLYGSDEVLSVYQKFLGDARTGVVDMERFGELIVAIRRDMGNAKTKLKSEDVLRQLITDYDQAKARGELRQQMT